MASSISSTEHAQSDKPYRRSDIDMRLATKKQIPVDLITIMLQCIPFRKPSTAFSPRPYKSSSDEKYVMPGVGVFKIVRVGVILPRYVTFKNSRPWVTHAYKNIKGRSAKHKEDVDDLSLNPITSGKSDPNLSEGGTSAQDKNKQLHSQTNTETEKPDNVTVNKTVGPTPSGDTLGQSTSSGNSGEANIEMITSGGDNFVMQSTDVAEENKESANSMDSSAISDNGQPLAVSLITEEVNTEQKSEKSSDTGISTRKRRKTTLQKLEETVKKTSDPLPISSYERVRLISRPWRKPEGTINRPVFKMMVESIMLYIISNPGCSFQSLCTKYSPYIQPIAILEIIEFLEELGCISRVILNRSHKSGLFTKRPVYTQRSELEQKDIEHYEATTMCTTKLGQFFMQI